MNSSPANAGSRKRTISDDDSSDYEWSSQSQSSFDSEKNPTFFESPNYKRLQQHRIHSEAHIRTVEMMLQAQLELQRQEKSRQTLSDTNLTEPPLDHTFSDITETNQESDNYRQRPFW
ncbi:predicted protein [Scheffersomyces stipitis CBS 6054]|uniref:Uncharacterized protein n=1 Tax=Scheffersomyces stipitis (strain ATCC 58785 / CBS 6054 / NBRC 10063 / NRRL Y-11545) TaxID=322104 RepID=A3LSX6_PICST|nr:predicted protein [Scheffersomyces stipitis CBS 6054]ABN66311.1 predicted protein [Scheffersomyces stipitis CBS 6054]